MKSGRIRSLDKDAPVSRLVADFAITSLHSYQEWKGLGAPLWRNFGAIVGFDFPDRCGFWLSSLLP